MLHLFGAFQRIIGLHTPFSPPFFSTKMAAFLLLIISLSSMAILDSTFVKLFFYNWYTSLHWKMGKIVLKKWFFCNLAMLHCELSKAITNPTTQSKYPTKSWIVITTRSWYFIFILLKFKQRPKLSRVLVIEVGFRIHLIVLLKKDRLFQPISGNRILFWSKMLQKEGKNTGKIKFVFFIDFRFPWLKIKTL